MSARRDLTGQRFGRLTVIALDEVKSKEKKQSYWICQCDCGNKKTIYGGSLTKGLTQSCGCLQREKTSIDLTNQRFGRLVALYKAESRYTNTGVAKTYWHCRCDCGNECDVKTEHLRKGYTKSCGCLYQKYQNERTEDLTGRRFGQLEVLYKDEKVSKEKGRTYWYCKCDCGNYCSIYHTHLLSGDTKSCGCLKSQGESTIEHILQSHNISYAKEYSFANLIGQNGGRLRFDFAVLKDNKLVGLIEFNGIQHYQPIDFFGGNERFAQ